MNKELKPCPFCGSEAERESSQFVEVVRCTLCPSVMAHDRSGGAVIAMWNTRTTLEVGGIE